MGTLIVQSQVEDYDRWREVYDRRTDIRERFGITDERVLRSVDDGNRLTVLMEGDLDQLRSLAGSEELREAMQEAGIVGPPSMTFAEDA